MTSSDTERKRSSLTSRSFRTQALLSSRRLGCSCVIDTEGGMKVGPDSGMGMGCAPEQNPQVPLVSQANWMRRLQREYSGPVESIQRRGTPGRRGDVDRDMVKVVSKTRERNYTRQESTAGLQGVKENMYPFLASRWASQRKSQNRWRWTLVICARTSLTQDRRPKLRASSTLPEQRRPYATSLR